MVNKLFSFLKKILFFFENTLLLILENYNVFKLYKIPIAPL
jgi:hypothetical protein